jgi:ABC-2 type transport system permease protein
MLGGLWIPSFILPGWARDIALSLPTTWAMRGLDQVTWQTGSFWSILPSLSALIAFMALFLSIAVAKILTSEARRRRGIL